MLTDCYLKIDTIDGESQQKGHEKWLELVGWNWSQQNKGSSNTGSGAGSGKVAMGDFQFRIKTGCSSPKLFLACATGQHIAYAVLHVRKAGGNQETFLEWKFADVLISMYRASMSMSQAKVSAESYGTDRFQMTDRLDHGVLPFDDVAFNFTQIETEYKPQKKDGTLGAGTKSGFNVKTGTKV